MKKAVTVTMDFEEYEILKKFKEGIEANHAIVYGYAGWHTRMTVFTTDEAVKRIAEYNQALCEEIDRIKRQLDCAIKDINDRQFIKPKTIPVKYISFGS